MKLAEALLIRSDLQCKISELEDRLSNNASVQEGDSPAEDPQELLAQLDLALGELERLIIAINHTNAIVQKEEVTMTAFLAKRDCLKRRLSIMRQFLNSASSSPQRTRASEILIRRTIPVAEQQKALDQQAAKLRSLELEIQALNWTSDLIES